MRTLNSTELSNVSAGLAQGFLNGFAQEIMMLFGVCAVGSLAIGIGIGATSIWAYNYYNKA